VDVSVVVATYGDDKWHRLARERAIPSAQALGVPVIHAVGATLHDARNTGLAQVGTRDVCFLDADDELEPGFFQAIARSTADLRVPSVRYVTPKRTPRPMMPRVAGHDHHYSSADCLPFGNWMVIGTVAPTRLLLKVGGFRDFDWSEDWDLWVRCWKAGATIDRVEDAVYRAHVRPDSRNRAPDRQVKHAVHQAIARANDLPVPA
jgi:glycosyltransferase involved in cell wall biosynthesis